MAKKTQYWLMKSEPSEYSIDDLAKAGTDFWFGIRNYQVRNMFRDIFVIGDKALFYHSNAGKETGVVGLMEVVSKAYPDKTQFSPTDKYYDAKSTPENPRWLGVEVRFLEKFPRLVSLAEIKADTDFQDMTLVQKGNRLSVSPVAKREFEKIVKIAKQ